MVELRRWLLTTSHGISISGALLLAAAGGCQSTSDYVAGSASTSPWTVPSDAEPARPAVVEPEPLPPVADVGPRPAVPYDEFPAEVPGPEALRETGIPAPAPAADMTDEEPAAADPASEVPTTVAVDDVAPAPEASTAAAPDAFSDGTPGLPSASTQTGPRADSLTSKTGAPSPAAGTAAEQNVAAKQNITAQQRSDAVPVSPTAPADPAASEDPASDNPNSSAPVALPLDPVKPPGISSDPPGTQAVPRALFEAPVESVVPGVPAETDRSSGTPVQSPVTEPASDQPGAGAEASSSSSRSGVRPLFPESRPSRTVVQNQEATGELPKIEQTRSTVAAAPGVTLPDPLPVTAAVSVRSGSGTTSRRADGDRPVRVRTIARVDSEVVGIAFDAHGNLLVSSDEGLSRISPMGTLRTFASLESPRGFAPLPDGSFAVCEARQRSLLRVDSSGAPIEFLAQRSQGHFLRAPSFLAVDNDGGVYFSDPGYARITAPTGRVHYRSASGEVRSVSERLAYPQGVALSNDGRKLFVVESQRNRILQFDIDSPGHAGPWQVHCELPPKSDADSDDFASGLIVNRDGSLFVARHGMQRVDVISADGRFTHSIPVRGVLASSLVLSEDQSELFVAGASATAQWAGIVVRVPVVPAPAR